jgi:hypothetical protein
VLSSPTGANLNGNIGTGTIRNDDNSLSVNNVTGYEGTSGTTPFTFTVTLAPAAAFPVTVHYATADGTAKAAHGDYIAVSGNLTFPPGTISLPVTVMVSSTATTGPAKTFYLDLSSPTNAVIVQATGTGKILYGAPPAGALVAGPGKSVRRISLGAPLLSAGVGPVSLVSSGNSGPDPGAAASPLGTRVLGIVSPAVDDATSAPADPLEVFVAGFGRRHVAKRRSLA